MTSDLTEIAAPAEPLEGLVSAAPVRRRGGRTATRVLGWVGFSLAAAVIAIVVLWSLVPGLFTSQDPLHGVPSDKLLPPSGAHWLGTDYLGRDLYARVVYGSRLSASSAVVAVLIGLLGGVTLGLAAGYLGRLADSVLSRFVDALLAIPPLLLAMVLVASLGFKTSNVAVAVGISSIALFARLTRSEVIRVRGLPFVESSGVVGGRRLQILGGHILPHVLPTTLAMAVLQFGYAVLSISSLAFLGYGSPPPTPDWGLLVAEGKDYLNGQPWMVISPSVVVVITVLAFQRLSQGLPKR